MILEMVHECSLYLFLFLHSNKESLRERERLDTWEWWIGVQTKNPEMSDDSGNDWWMFSLYLFFSSCVFIGKNKKIEMLFDGVDGLHQKNKL